MFKEYANNSYDSSDLIDYLPYISKFKDFKKY